MSAGPVTCPEGHNWDALDPIVIWDEPLLSHHVFKFIGIELGEAPLL